LLFPTEHKDNMLLILQHTCTHVRVRMHAHTDTHTHIYVLYMTSKIEAM